MRGYIVIGHNFNRVKSRLGESWFLIRGSMVNKRIPSMSCTPVYTNLPLKHCSNITNSYFLIWFKTPLFCRCILRKQLIFLSYTLPLACTVISKMLVYFSDWPKIKQALLVTVHGTFCCPSLPLLCTETSPISLFGLVSNDLWPET